MIEEPLWKCACSKKNTIVLQGKKVKNCINILGTLGLFGPQTTRGIAKNVLKMTEGYEYHFPRDEDVKILEQIFYKLIKHRLKKVSGKRKYSSYPNLMETGYVYKIGTITNEKSLKVDQYFLTLKGCLFLLSLDFKDEEFIKIIKNCGKYHLYFGMLQSLLDLGVSLLFLKKIFINSIRDELINKNKVNFDASKNISFYYNSIGEECGKALWNEITKVNEKIWKKEIKKGRKKLPRSHEDLPETKDIDIFLQAYTKLLARKGKNKFFSDLSDLYFTNFSWREKVLKQLYGQITKPFDIIEDNSDEFRLFLYLLLHLDLATFHAYE